MKLIAIKQLFKVPALKAVKIPGAANDREIPKGARFEIGEASKIKALAPQEQVLVAQLIASGTVGDASDPEVVRAVEEDVAAEKRSAEARAKAEAAASNSGLVAQLTALLEKAAGGKK